MTRMWMIDPKIMCRQHLLGEHKEIHQLLGSLKSGHSIKGYLDKGLVEPQNIFERHAKLSNEMLIRGFSHNSEVSREDFEAINKAPECRVNREESKKELLNRCSECKARNKEKGGKND